MSAFVLVHSPLVGPLTWRRTAAALEASGRKVIVPSLAGVMGGGPPYHRRLADAVAGAIGDAAPGGDAGPEAGEVVLVVHSGAGALVPAIVEAVKAPVAAAVFVDALVPRPGARWFDTAPEELRAGLLAMADDGLLPPWHQWFPPETLEQVLPDEEQRERFVAELDRLPLAWFAEPAPAAPGWPSVSCGYVQLSDGYQAEAELAVRQGWPVVRVQADHLAMLTRSDGLAEVIGATAGALTRYQLARD